MTSIASYLRNEFVARFPSCAIDVTFHDDETISVTLSSRNEPAMRITYRCETSSDDDMFVFLNDDDASPICIAIPDDIA